MKLTDLSLAAKESSVRVDRQDITARVKFPESNLPFYRQLGRTDLTVSCLGIGGGGAISSEDTLYAFDRGINYFFYSSDLHHHNYGRMADALRKLCGRGSKVREQVVLATVTYIVKTPEAAIASLIDQFSELGIDYIDVFFWGWVDDNNAGAFAKCIDATRDMRGTNSVYQRYIESMLGTSEKMKEMGIVRYVGASFHSHDLAQKWLNHPLLDVAMVRHNIAHRQAQSKIFAHLDEKDSQRSGIVTFKSTGMGTYLWEPPLGLPRGCWHPSPTDLYRYSLSQNCVDVALAGWTSRRHIDEGIEAVQKGKLTSQEIDYLNLYGDFHRNRVNLREIIPSERLLYR
jgi:aryl-alcohol dehydrogenase-like predicted oxidoreductase